MARHSRTDGEDLRVALRHPTRRRILRAVKNQDLTTTAELAEALDRPLANIRYHVAVLRSAVGNSWDERNLPAPDPGLGAAPAGESRDPRAT
jgi:hypothetical protein